MKLRAALLVCVLLPACSAREPSHVDKLRPASGPKQPMQPPTPSALTGTALTSYWQGSEAQRAAELFEREEWQQARTAFAALSSEDDAAKARQSLMLAVCDSKLGNHKDAALRFTELEAQLPALLDFLRYNAARSHYFARNLDEAMKSARAVDGDTIHGADAQLLIGDLLRAGDDSQAVYQHYKDYLVARPGGIRRPEARFYMASAAASLGRVLEASELFREIAIDSPLTGWASKADKSRAALAGKLKAEDRARLQSMRASEYVTRGQVFYDNNRSDKSEADFAAALLADGLTPELACEASFYRANSVYKLRDRTRAIPLFQSALELCKSAQNSDLYVKAAYQTGRSYTALGERDKAIEYYGLVEATHPEHSYADDARLLAAEAYRDLGNAEKEGELLEGLADAYPKGDMRTEALWRLAFRAYKAKKFREAIAWLDKQIQSAPVDDRFWAEGQAQYWIGRAQDQLGKSAASTAAYREVIETYPLSYYALMALNRLREKQPTLFAELWKEIHAAPPAGEGEFHFRDRPEYKRPGFARALEFLRLGLASEAGAELSRLGFRSPPGRDRITDPDQIDKTWAVSFLHHSIGDYARGLWSTRWHVLDYKRHWPEGAWRQRWDIAYPPGYRSLIDKHAKAQGIPPDLLISFVREESGFDPIQESVANAIGLSQLITPTAKRFAEGTNIAVSRETLRDPDLNLQIGSRFMSFLMRKWNQQISLVVPSYNAGEGAVARWMNERGDWPRDEFVEEIPYDETRNYTKRVIATYFTYSYLLHDEIPVFPNSF